MGIAGWVFLAVVVLLLLYVVGVYNRLVRLRALVREGFSGITVQLRRRADLIPNLVEAVKGYATHEREVLDQVTARRADATKASSVEATAQADAQMTSLLGRLMVVAEAYPDLKASQNFQDLQDELSAIEGGAAERTPLLQCDRSRPEHDRPELPARPHRSSVRLQRGALLPGRRPRHSKRSEGFVRTPGGLAMPLIVRVLSGLLLLGAAAAAHAEERIQRFVSDVQIQKDSSLEVTETIDVRAEHNQINRGIYRDFPTRYRGRRGNQVRVGFTFQGATLDGMPVPAKTESISNGVRIRIGDPDKYVEVGEHRYVIRYSTTRQIGRFNGFDELYWNATGNGWIFPIDVAEARIRLPEAVSFGERASYTGPQGSTSSNARVVEEKPGEIRFQTTGPLGPNEGLTVAVAFPKGVVARGE